MHGAHAGLSPPPPPPLPLPSPQPFARDRVLFSFMQAQMPSQRRSTTLFIIWISVLATPLALVSSQAVSLNSTISTGDVVCPEEIVIFTCVTRDSAIIGWNSVEYIGTGFQLEFDEGSNHNEIRMGSTVATFVNDTLENGTRVLVSQLQITVSSISATPSVTCVHVSNNEPATFTFQVLIANPGVPQAIAYQTEDATGQCTLHISWTVPDDTSISDIDHFAISIDGINALNRTSNNNDTLFSIPYVLRSCEPHNVSIRIWDRCGQVGQPSNTVSPETLCDVTTCNGGSAAERGSLTGWRAAVGSLAILLALALALVGFLIILVYVCMWHSKQKKWTSVAPAEEEPCVGEELQEIQEVKK